jgi:catabolite repression HPr-like protein
MIEAIVTVNLDSGLHARPAANFVRLASSYTCEITIKKGDKAANAKSILGVMSLAIEKGAKVTICCNGDREQEASEKLASLLQEEV